MNIIIKLIKKVYDYFTNKSNINGFYIEIENSSNVNNIKWDSYKKLLTIEYYKYDETMTYIYYGVDDKTINELLICFYNGDSVGSFLHKHIRNKYACKKIK